MSYAFRRRFGHRGDLAGDVYRRSRLKKDLEAVHGVTNCYTTYSGSVARDHTVRNRLIGEGGRLIQRIR